MSVIDVLHGCLTFDSIQMIICMDHVKNTEPKVF